MTTSLVDINLGINILLGSSFYDDWEGQSQFVTKDPLGNPVGPRHPWNQHTLPQPQKRDFDNKYSWVMSPRWFDGTDYLALDTGGGPIARLWSTALAGLVDIGYIRSTGSSVKITLPKTALLPETEFEWKIPQWSNAIERDRARTYFQAYACAAAYHFAEQALKELRAGNTKTWERFDVPDEAIGCGFTEAVRGVLSHHVVIREGKIANYHPYPPTPWNANPTDSLGTMGPYEDAVTNTPIFEENDDRQLQGRRHHAGRAQLRPVPAVRRAHVPRGGPHDREGALADPGARPRLTALLDGRDRARRCSTTRPAGSRSPSTTSARSSSAARHGDQLAAVIVDAHAAGFRRLLELAADPAVLTADPDLAEVLWVHEAAGDGAADRHDGDARRHAARRRSSSRGVPGPASMPPTG